MLTGHNKKLACSADPFLFANAMMLALHMVSFFCDTSLPVYMGGIITGFYLCSLLWSAKEDYGIAIRSWGLGIAFAVGLTIFYHGRFWQFGLYLCALSFFHWSEFVVLAYVNPASVTISAFMLNHSLEYYVAAVSSWIEFFTESYFFPDMKAFRWLSLFGLVLIIIGEIVRKLAILHLGPNFTHIVQMVPLENHRLITSGLYAYIRHPSYAGWFWFSIGTQILLLNPLCVVAYAATAWLFFRDRIEAEEMLLTQFFGSAYLTYMQKTMTGVPFIKGYKYS